MIFGRKCNTCFKRFKPSDKQQKTCTDCQKEIEARDKEVEKEYKKVKIQYQNANKNLPECNCKYCKYVWVSRKKGSLPGRCPRCNKAYWWTLYNLTAEELLMDGEL